VTGTNLDVLFEDVPVTDTDNQLEELIDGVIFNIKRSEPGTRIQVSILHDIEKTMESIKSFVEKYNQVSNFVHQQYQENPETGKRGILSGDGTIKSVMRGLQTSLMDSKNPGGKFGTLADIGITTDPKTGNLKMDDAKVKQALTEDYEGVAKLFIRGKGGGGLSDALATKVKAFQDPASGVVRSRLRGLDNTIKTQDEGIERRERMLASKEESIRRRFAALEGQMANLQSQGGILAARLGGGGGQGGGGGKASAGGDG
jgi:flagellar hook-associated protein 2